MNNLFNKVLLERRTAVAIKASNFENDDAKVLAIMADIAQLGYTFDKPLIDVLKTQNDSSLSVFHSFLVNQLKVMVGANVRYVPLFKNFPNDIPDDVDFLFKRILTAFKNVFKTGSANYAVLSCGHVIDTDMFNLADFGACPLCLSQVDELMSHDDSASVENTKNLKVIKLVDESVIYEIFKNVISSRSPISETDKSFISDMFTIGESVEKYIPKEIFQKEIIALVCGLLVKYSANYESLISEYMKTATDVLRFAVQLCDGDVSLKENTKFKLNNTNRRLIMSLLNNVSNPEADMLRYRSQWLRLGEVLHIGSKKDKYPKAYVAFDVLRNDQKSIETFNRKVESLLSKASKTEHNESLINDLINLLASRAGEFARRLDTVIRVSNNKEMVIDKFNTVTEQLTTPLLMSIKSHFKNRDTKSDFRFFIPKGKLAKIHFEENDDRSVIEPKYIESINNIIEETLIKRFSNEDSLGKVYIDPSLENVLVPLSQRNASKALQTVPRGSRIKVDENSPFIRLFTYWKAPVDVDLAAICFDKDWVNKDYINYYSLSGYGASRHSGDIVNGQNGACEFIDLDINAFKKKDIRYVAVTLISYRGDHFNTFECFSGFMERDNSSSKQFDATTVKQRFDVAADATSCVPMIFDLETSELIWTDFVMHSNELYSNYHNSSGKLVQLAKSSLKLSEIKPNIFDLFMLHAKARADSIDTIRNNEIEYDTVLDLETAKNLDEIMSKWLK